MPNLTAAWKTPTPIKMGQEQEDDDGVRRLLVRIDCGKPFCPDCIFVVFI
jgi:hypothetical protein